MQLRIVYRENAWLSRAPPGLLGQSLTKNVYWGKPLLGAQRAVRASTKSMLCHRKSASSLSMGTSICCKMAFPGNSAWKCSFYGRKLIAEATFCCSSNRQSRSCGLLMKGLKPFHTFLGFVDSLTALWSTKNGFPQTPFREKRIRDKGKRVSYGNIIAIIAVLL